MSHRLRVSANRRNGKDHSSNVTARRNKIHRHTPNNTKDNDGEESNHDGDEAAGATNDPGTASVNGVPCDSCHRIEELLLC